MRGVWLAWLVSGCNQVYGLDRTELLDSKACKPGTSFGAGVAVSIDPFYSVEAVRFTRARGVAYLSLCPATTMDNTSQCDLYTAPYSPLTETFSGFSKMNGVSGVNAYDAYPTITSDDQHLLFASDRSGNIRIYVAATRNSSFDDPTITQLPGTGESANEPYIVGEGRVLYFAQGGPPEVFRMEGDPPLFGGQPVAVAGVNIANQGEFAPVLRDSELEIFFSSGVDVKLDLDLYVASRGSAAVPFDTPERVTELSTSGNDWPVYISPDGCDLYYISKRDNVATLYVAKR